MLAVVDLFKTDSLLAPGYYELFVNMAVRMFATCSSVRSMFERRQLGCMSWVHFNYNFIHFMQKEIIINCP